MGEQQLVQGYPQQFHRPCKLKLVCSPSTCVHIRTHVARLPRLAPHDTRGGHQLALCNAPLVKTKIRGIYRCVARPSSRKRATPFPAARLRFQKYLDFGSLCRAKMRRNLCTLVARRLQLCRARDAAPSWSRAMMFQLARESGAQAIKAPRSAKELSKQRQSQQHFIQSANKSMFFFTTEVRVAILSVVNTITVFHGLID